MDLKLDGKVALVAGSSKGIGEAIAFLASPRAGYITGMNLRLDGGMLPSI